jgi:hypothetical protein
MVSEFGTKPAVMPMGCRFGLPAWQPRRKPIMWFCQAAVAASAIGSLLIS